MSPERWQQVCDLFESALRCDLEARQALLQEACANDPGLRAEVDRLLIGDEQAQRQDFMKSAPTTGSEEPRDNPVRRILADVNLRASPPVRTVDNDSDVPVGKTKGLFDETNWSLIKAAQAGQTSQARVALAELCTSYWFPLYAYVRRRGYASDQAQDLTQGFFLSLLEHDFLKGIGREKGKFRSFLLTSCRNYLINQGDRQRAKKRGHGRVVFNIDHTDAEGRYAREPASKLTAERIFERHWALTLLERVIHRLEAEMLKSGKKALFDRLGVASLGRSDVVSHAQVAQELNMTEGAVKVAAHRLRGRYRELIRDEVRLTVDATDDVDDEIRALLAALRT